MDTLKERSLVLFKRGAAHELPGFVVVCDVPKLSSARRPWLGLTERAYIRGKAGMVCCRVAPEACGSVHTPGRAVGRMPWSRGEVVVTRTVPGHASYLVRYLKP